MKNFEVYWKDELTARVKIEKSKVYIERLVIHPVKQIFCKDEMTLFELGEVLTLRCWDKNRMNLHLYLEKLGVNEYNPFLICEKTHGVMYQDFIWFKFEGEAITSSDVLIKR